LPERGQSRRCRAIAAHHADDRDSIAGHALAQIAKRGDVIGHVHGNSTAGALTQPFDQARVASQFTSVAVDDDGRSGRLHGAPS
jgi:hypothetical protein